MTALQSACSDTSPLLRGTDIIASARALAPEIASRVDEIAALRRLPNDLVVALKNAGVFRMAMPRAWGGPEMTPREQCEVYEVLGAADASVGTSQALEQFHQQLAASEPGLHITAVADDRVSATVDGGPAAAF